MEPLDKQAILGVLREMADILEIADASVFEVMAYRNGAANLEDWDGDLHAAVREGTLTDLPGIGKGLSAVITDLATSGESAEHRRLRGLFPTTLLELLAVPGLGTRKVRSLHSQLGIDSLDALEAAARAQQIRELQGFGAKSEERILSGIERARRFGRR